MDIIASQKSIIEEFSSFEDWMDKYAYLIELGNNLDSFPEEYRKDENLIEGCQSKVWFHADYKDGKIYFMADSDAIITKGIASLLIRVLSGRTPQEIIDADLFFIEKIGLQQHLSPTRANGLLAMIKQLKYYAMAYKSIEK